ncbi:hypothetical protein CARUB_v10003901mg [Capsella rubella]|uniref:PGG domain-containing protein n=1 Tax=Capsella rubella TaxID=81985 RepID=R0HH37_9BRAS|nr:protein ACCELERATED CELL DEATH 6 [Capsella rubella]EOA23108.1 hypothetical protein CARUB_v10003901mg [Capsella rubella]
MDFSEARLDTIESQSSTDSSNDQRRQRYFSMNKINNSFRTLSSRAFLRGRGEATPQPMEDTEDFVPEFFIDLRLSDFFDLPGEYVLMNAEMFSTLSGGGKEWLEKLRSHGTPLACLKNDRGDSILHLAARWGHLELVKRIFSEYPCLLLEPNLKDQLPIHVASSAGHAAVVEALVATVTFVSAGISKEERKSLNTYLLKDINGDTALNLALRRGYMKIASSLVNADHSASFLANKDRISPLYMAVEAGYVSLVREMLGNDGHEGGMFNLQSQLEGRKYLAHAALKSMSIGTLDVILNEYPNLMDERDEEGRTCLSFGASIGCHETVCNLLDRSTKGIFVCDDDGSYPIHVAAEQGHIKVVNEILKRCKVSKYMLNRKDQNILHIAANCGKFGILREFHNSSLANEQDVDGNTPLHLATIKWRPRAVRHLAGPNNLFIQNNIGLAALDIAEINLQPNYIVRERLTLVAFVDAHYKNDDPRYMHTMKLLNQIAPMGGANKDFINALLVVAALIATVTFTAGFTIPGGFRSSTPNLGMANLVTNPRLILFLIFDISALGTSFFAVISLILAQLGDPALYQSSVRTAMTSVYFAIYFMSLAFFSAMVIAAGNVIWLIVVLYLSSMPFLSVMFSLFFPHFLLLRVTGSPSWLGKFLGVYVASANDDDESYQSSSANKSVKILGNDNVEINFKL